MFDNASFSAGKRQKANEILNEIEQEHKDEEESDDDKYALLKSLNDLASKTACYLVKVTNISMQYKFVHYLNEWMNDLDKDSLTEKQTNSFLVGLDDQYTRMLSTYDHGRKEECLCSQNKDSSSRPVWWQCQHEEFGTLSASMLICRCTLTEGDRKLMIFSKVSVKGRDLEP